MKTVITAHPEIGYSNNVAIVEDALRHLFGCDDQSSVLTAVAAHVWSRICATSSTSEKPDGKRWGTAEVIEAVRACRFRLENIEKAVMATPSDEPFDRLTRAHTGFGSFEEMLNVEGSYRPSFYVRGEDASIDAEIRMLAERYDAEQAKRGSDRRTHRVGF